MATTRWHDTPHLFLFCKGVAFRPLAILVYEMFRSGGGLLRLFHSLPLDEEDVTARASVTAVLQQSCKFERVVCTSRAGNDSLWYGCGYDRAGESAGLSLFLFVYCLWSRVLYCCFSSTVFSPFPTHKKGGSIAHFSALSYQIMRRMFLVTRFRFHVFCESRVIVHWMEELLF